MDDDSVDRSTVVVGGGSRSSMPFPPANMRDLPGQVFDSTSRTRKGSTLFPWAQPGAPPATPVVPSVIRGRDIAEAPPDAGRILESCPVRGGMSIVLGGAMGYVLGVLLTSYERITPPEPALPGQPAPPKIPLRESIRDGFKQMQLKGISWGKNFAMVGGVFATIECFIEEKRGRHDTTNSVAAGCVTGAALAHKAGPQAMCIGCAGFAAFSVVIEKVMGPGF